MANKDAAKPEEAPKTHATYERSEEQTTQKKGETSTGKRCKRPAKHIYEVSGAVVNMAA